MSWFTGLAGLVAWAGCTSNVVSAGTAGSSGTAGMGGTAGSHGTGAFPGTSTVTSTGTDTGSGPSTSTGPSTSSTSSGTFVCNPGPDCNSSTLPSLGSPCSTPGECCLLDYYCDHNGGNSGDWAVCSDAGTWYDVSF